MRDWKRRNGLLIEEDKAREDFSSIKLAALPRRVNFSGRRSA